MEGVIKWNREVITGLTEMVTFDQRPERESVSPTDQQLEAQSKWSQVRKR